MRRTILVLWALSVAACSPDAPSTDAGMDAAPALDAGTTDASALDGGSGTDSGSIDAARGPDADCGDTSSDPDRCGGCAVVCPEVPGAARTCVAGACGYECQSGRLDCNDVATDGCEASANSSSNCRACGVTCVDPPNGYAVCGPDGCESRCLSGVYDDCDGEASNGCETAVAADPSNCGACGVICPSGPSGEPSCEGGACGLACEDGLGDCNGSIADGCERSLTSDEANCGACGNACPAGTPCHGGECRELVAFVTSIPLPVPGGQLASLGDPLVYATTFCNGLAAAAGLTGDFDPWLSTSTSSPSTRFSRVGGWEDTSGDTIATSFADLVDGTLTSLLQRDENGALVPTVTDYMGTRVGYSCTTSGTIDQYNVLTGTLASGASGGRAGTCDDYTSSAASARAHVGSSLRGTASTPNRWTTTACSLTQSCTDRLWRLYCFEQAEP